MSKPNPYANPPANLSATAPSALFGKPANNVNDWYVAREFARIVGIPDHAFNPSKGFPYHVPSVQPSYQSKGPRIVASACVAILLILFITVSRLSLRYFRKDLKFGYDDLFIVPAVIGVVSWFCIVIWMVIKGGAGQHIYDITYMQVEYFFRGASSGQLVFFLSTGLVKISISLFNRRLTGLTSKRWMIAHNVFLVILVAYMIYVLFVNLFVCIPFDHFSIIEAGKFARPAKCSKTSQLNIALSSIHVILDYALLSVPIIILYQIQMSTTKKVRLGLFFCIGALSCIGATIRPIVIQHGSPDITYYFQDQYSWGTVDIFFAAIAASLPVLNAAIPKGWRRRTHTVKRLRSINAADNGTDESTSSNEMTSWQFGRDGTV
ncbi:hypothetical protein N7G274_008050 [Stereocaulon virgatum]|uniref:Rhodopsin domain-containing protein n=1 Tax=Stereocaulon virgatum TaxID=373712 RepID=A0ABR4A0C7_9LECA